MIYVGILYTAQIIQRQNELEGMWKDAIVARLMLLSRNLLGGAEEKHQDMSE
jgi:hypothetical protein